MAKGLHIFPDGRITELKNLTRLYYYTSTNRNRFGLRNRQWQLKTIEVRETVEPNWDVLVVYRFTNGHMILHYWADRKVMYQDMQQRLLLHKWQPSVVIHPGILGKSVTHTPIDMVNWIQHERHQAYLLDGT